MIMWENISFYFLKNNSNFLSSTGEIVRISMDEEEELVDRSRLVKNKEKFFAFFRFSNVKESLWTGFREREQGR